MDILQSTSGTKEKYSLKLYLLIKIAFFIEFFDRSKYEPCLKSISQSTDVVNFVFPRLTFFKLKKIQIKITVDLSNRVGSWKS